MPLQLSKTFFFVVINGILAFAIEYLSFINMQFSLLHYKPFYSFIRLRRIEYHRNKIIPALMRFIQRKHPENSKNAKKRKCNSTLLVTLHLFFGSERNRKFSWIHLEGKCQKSCSFAVEYHLPHEQFICNHIYGLHYLLIIKRSHQRLRKTNRVENKFSVLYFVRGRSARFLRERNTRVDRIW